MTLPFLDLGDRLAGRLASAGASSVAFAGSSSWDKMLAQDRVPLAYFAEIEPWVLADRS